MTDCIKYKNEKPSVCIGALNKKIAIQSRDMSFSSFIDNDENFVTLYEPWARVTTKTQEAFFDETNTSGIITHTFDIRYNKNYTITSENFILYKSKRYKILKVENIGEDDLYIRMDCVIRGSENFEVNKA